MELLTHTDVPSFVIKPPRPLAIAAIVLALAGLVIAICAPAFLEAKEAPPDGLPQVLAESAHNIKEHLAHKEINADPKRLISWKTALMISGGLVGFLGAVLGTGSWMRREKPRLSSIAIAAGLTAIAWNHFLLAALAAVSLLLMAWVISHFHR